MIVLWGEQGPVAFSVYGFYVEYEHSKRPQTQIASLFQSMHGRLRFQLRAETQVVFLFCFFFLAVLCS